MLQGMTAHYLAHSTYPLKSGDVCLVHAGAGGVGLLLTQIAKMRGARVITTVSTEEKAALSREAGADLVVLYTRQDFEAEVKAFTGGKGVPVVYDSVGLTTFEKSINCWLPRGMLVLFGQSSGLVPPVDPQYLSQKGSLFFTRPTLVHYIASRDELQSRARDLVSWVGSGALRLRTEFEFPLKDAAEAHKALARTEDHGKGAADSLVLLSDVGGQKDRYAPSIAMGPSEQASSQALGCRHVTGPRIDFGHDKVAKNIFATVWIRDSPMSRLRALFKRPSGRV